MVREQNVVVGAKGTIGRLDRLSSISKLCDDGGRGVIDVMANVEPDLADRLSVLCKRLCGTRIEDADRVLEAARGKIAEQAAQVCRPIVGRNE